MANKATTHVIRGVLNYAKVLGKARPHTGDPKFDKGPYWSVDIAPDADGLVTLTTTLSKKHFAEKMREAKSTDKNRAGQDDFLTFRHYLYNKDGEENEPISVKDASGNDWPQNRMLGNGTIADVKYRKVDYGTTVGLYIQAIRVLKPVAYEVEAFAPLSEDDEFFGEGAMEDEGKPESASQEEDLDDDVPF